MKRFLDLSDLSDEQLEDVLDRARELEAHPLSDALARRVVGLVFMNPSLRTLASMEAGIAQLGGSSFVISPGQSSWKLETRDGAVMDGDAVEHVREAIPVLAEYCDALGVRCFAEGKDLAADLDDGVIRAMARLSPVPFVNLESAVSHPCQALADWKTLDDFEIPRRRDLRPVVGLAPQAAPLRGPGVGAEHGGAARDATSSCCGPRGTTCPAR